MNESCVLFHLRSSVLNASIQTYCLQISLICGAKPRVVHIPVFFCGKGTNQGVKVGTLPVCDVKIFFLLQIDRSPFIFVADFILEMFVLILTEQNQSLAVLLQHTVDKNKTTVPV